jgi:hypothetical protein
MLQFFVFVDLECPTTIQNLYTILGRQVQYAKRIVRCELHFFKNFTALFAIMHSYQWAISISWLQNYTSYTILWLHGINRDTMITTKCEILIYVVAIGCMYFPRPIIEYVIATNIWVKFCCNNILCHGTDGVLLCTRYWRTNINWTP